MRLKLAAAVGVALAVAISAAACDTAERGNPRPQSTTASVSSTPPGSSTSSPSTTSSLPFAGAPKVAEPLDVSRFVADPCLALSSSQVAQLKVGQGKKSQGNLGPVCDWRNVTAGSDVNVEFLSDSREGLSAVYRAHDEGKFEMFEPAPEVSGLPAVYTAKEGEKSLGMCFVYIGLSDELALQLGTTQSLAKQGSSDPCDATKAVAQLVLQTMKAGG
jgi:uncharacterized protein DUF3558